MWVEVQGFLDSLLEDEVLLLLLLLPLLPLLPLLQDVAASELLYTFLSPSPEHLKVVPEQVHLHLM